MRHIKNSKVCVIGGAGFLGSHLVDYLIDERGCEVLVLDNLITGLRKHLHEDAAFEWYFTQQLEKYKSTGEKEKE